jgi:hypothetical protein
VNRSSPAFGKGWRRFAGATFYSIISNDTDTFIVAKF